MPRKTFAGNYSATRLRRLLVVLFAALALPTGAVVWQAYGQLKFEAFYQYRNQAEALAERIDSGLLAGIDQAEARGFADFRFLNVAGDASSNIVQRSPLSDYPVNAGVPGAIGYFQVDANGEFSTPLLPDPGTAAVEVGLSEPEFRQRTELAHTIRQILADNRLIRERPGPGGRTGIGSASGDAAREYPAELPQPAAGEYENGLQNQQGFDLLNQAVQSDEAVSVEGPRSATTIEPARADLRENARGKLRDLKLDEDLQKKSEILERRLSEDEADATHQSERSAAATKERRGERLRLPATGTPVSLEEALVTAEPNARITTFESEIDPYEFSLLDSGHMVLFRNVWRDERRYVQGLLIDQAAFLDRAVAAAYRATTLASMSDLIVGYRDDVISMIRGDEYRSYPPGGAGLEGTLLHRARLSAPFDGVELVFSINRLPSGPGGNVLAWTTVVIAVVFVAGFLALYRLGVGQIRLARQQQDFVSAVSHELKTPLTSIRMYGEMLREGWVDEDKRRKYYEYIHDESERLTRLISNVLRLAKITRNEPRPDLGKTTVGALVSHIESKIASQVERAGFLLEFAIDEPVQRANLTIDDDCFAQIVINLVDNAIKFSKSAERKIIRIGCVPAGDDELVFTVRDYGPGVPRDQMKKIFTLFYRSETELTRETVGTGIGLAIVHQLTVAMHGKVDVVNRDPGAEFRLTFPRIS